MDREIPALRKCVVAIGLMLIAVAISWTGVLERMSSKYVDDALTQAFSAYAVARGVNAVVSVLQSISVGGSLGASFTVSPGEALDPINDLVERYATVMEFSIGSLLTQKILIEITSSRIFNVLLSIGVAAFVLSLLSKAMPWRGVLYRSVLSLLFLRFAVVFAVLANGWVDVVFLREGIDQNVAGVGGVSESVGTRIGDPAQAREPVEKEGLLDSLKNGFSGLSGKAKGMLAQVDAGAAKEELEKAIPSMVDLMAVFVLKTLLLPLLFLYGLKRAFAELWGWRGAGVAQAVA